MNAKEFMDRVEKTESCWNWMGSLKNKGYGRVHLSSGKTLAHRLSWELFVGDIPAEMHVLHTCDNRACVRPDHLFLGTEFDNGKDAAIKDRRRQKLTANQVREIRVSSGTHVDIANRFGIHQCNVSRIKRGERRQYVS
jgi:hypothetical protein